MIICGYMVFSEPGAGSAVAERLSALPGCDVVPARNHDVLLMVSESSGRDEEAALRERVERTSGVTAVVLTFGEIGTGASSPAMPPTGRGGGRRLPVVGS